MYMYFWEKQCTALDLRKFMSFIVLYIINYEW